jgi:hypothetical protein
VRHRESLGTDPSKAKENIQLIENPLFHIISILHIPEREREKDYATGTRQQ